MSLGPRTVHTLSLLAALGGVATIALSSPWTSAELVADAVLSEARAAFAEEPWSYAPWAALAGMGLAGVMRIAERIAMRQPVRRAAPRPLPGKGLDAAIAELRYELELVTKGREPDAVLAVEHLLKGAAKMNASDVHVTPSADETRLSCRVDGDLHDIAILPIAAHAPIATRLKVLARLEPYVRAQPQDGRLVLPSGKESIEARLSTLPTEQGERLVLRLVRSGRQVPDIDSLGFSQPIERALVELLSKPQGLLFVTGPVGSGKTTTLYASLKHLAKTRKGASSLVTLEDPIELELDFATQTQINPRTGMTFASTLRSVLRQDPNVLMVGEIRDRETAEIAMQAGLTGHLILTTVHGQSAAGAFARLIEMDVEPFVLASATLGSLSQRLVRALCVACRVEAPVTELVTERFARAGMHVPAGVYYEPKGCEHCQGQGYTGRLPIAELLIVDEPLRKAIHDKSTTSALEQLAAERGMVTLLADGLACARRGETSLLEVLRVAG